MLDKLFHFCVWFLAALTFAISLSYPSGYNIGATLIFLLGMIFLFVRDPKSDVDKSDVQLIFTFAVYGLLMFFFVYLDGFHIRELDRPSRFILVLPIALLLMRLNGPREWMFYGVVIGAISAAILGVYERMYLGLGRAHGNEHPIMFGNIAMMLGMLSFVCALYFYSKKSIVWTVLSSLGCVCGVAASVMSASRGGWVALPLVGLFLLWNSRFLLGKKRLLKIALSILVAFFTVYFVPQTGVEGRINQALNDITRYDQGIDKNSSVGLRFEMWKGAIKMFEASPMVGVGEYGSYSFKQGLIRDGVVSEKVLMFSHAHNEYLNSLGLTGILGFIALMLVYLVPLKLFLGKMKEHQDDWNIRSYAMAGALVPMCYMDFALSQSMFSHSIGVMMYAFPIVYFWAALRWAERESLAKASVA
ncbi:O-antigen ligase family protein [Marinomonas posidonica]|uniref:O-antigen polymerase n=1 Tax=Marinomonas posidonica (strain CECT 7376 / NCIMB 14433 / IVIA-Po-181) TaxID=491952 RepID=F6CZQ9_MARPP|nr:O-antigen ligase family protein [Marinomonas posidonica]AEF53570.1 O-antigen polymerase [Marinomonas posidonica IVIA-Po-181]